MTARDGGLRALFRRKMPEAHWQSIEVGGVGIGVPDAEFCFPGGAQGWIEFKTTRANAVGLMPHQVAWIDRRHRVGGRALVAVRKRRPASKRLEACDELHIFSGGDVKRLHELGLIGVEPMAHELGGPAAWDWEAIAWALRTLR